MLIAINACYNLSSVGYADLGDKTWDDVQDWNLKWDKLSVLFKGEDTYHTFALDSSHEDIDWKYPNCASVHPTDDEKQVDFDEELDSLEN